LGHSCLHFTLNREPFDVALQGLASFGGRKPRAVVASIVPSRPLIELQAELERLMQRFGLDPEGRKFTPHVTLARLRDASNQDVADYLSGALFPDPGVHGLALRAVLLARLHRRRALCGRGFLCAERVRALFQIPFGHVP
jgi:2'-5' RNA ligase